MKTPYAKPVAFALTDVKSSNVS